MFTRQICHVSCVAIYMANAIFWYINHFNWFSTESELELFSYDWQYYQIMTWNYTHNKRLQIAWKSLNCILLSVGVCLKQYLAIFNFYLHFQTLFYYFHRNKCWIKLKNIHSQGQTSLRIDKKQPIIITKPLYKQY